MRKDIEVFYNAAKVEKLADATAGGEVPLTHIKVFHKRYPRLPRVALPDTQAGGQLFDLLRSRKSSRSFSEAPLHLNQLARILASCAIVDASGQVERRTYPSAGARFPVETYLISFRVDDLIPGCYHYDIEHPALELLWEQDLGSRVREIVSPAVEHPAAALVFTSVISRVEVKYGARAYPFSLLEAGHMAQNVSLVCTQMGIGSCPVGGFVNDTLSNCLDLTGDEIPIYAMALGVTAEAG
jgi:SagB-type dehydrogenase family enzyme